MKQQYKVCVYAICKNEESFVDRWMDSMNEADLVVVTDTGSSDRTVELLRERGAVVHSAEVKPWRFDTARNISLSHVPEDTDICVCTDLDEIFHPGWRKQLEQAWQPDAHMANYLYNWSLKPDGTPGTQFVYFKIHNRTSYKWAYPIHECLRYIGTEPERKVFAHGVVLDHYPDSTKPRSSYLPLLEMAVEEQPEDDRVAYYLGREYMYAGEWQKCIDALKRHLSLPSAHWAEERCASMRWIAKSCLELGNHKEAYRWYYRAVAEAPHLRDPYVEFSRMAQDLGDWETCFCMAEEALNIHQRSTVYVNMEYSWDATPYDLAALAAFHLGLHRKAVGYGAQALELEPENQRLQGNLQFYTQADSRTK